jgi:hypothetical protein
MKSAFIQSECQMPMNFLLWNLKKYIKIPFAHLLSGTEI